MTKQHINIGLFGFGNVGRGLYELLKRVPEANAEIVEVCVRNLEKHSKEAGDLKFTDNATEVLDNPDVNLIVELIDDADAAYEIVTAALRRRLPVVTGNKKMLARHLPELIKLQKEMDTALLYDASACGSIPVIRNLEEYYDNDLQISVKGILNGSSNFILSKIFNDGMEHEDALLLARELGFLESDPTLDLDGWDSLFKLVILTLHAFGVYVEPERIFTYGITHMTDADIRFAREKERRFKLIGHAEKTPDGRLILAVMPQLISRNKFIYSCEDEFNGVVIKGLFYGKQFLVGRGAGGHPTSSAVLSDISAIRYDYFYRYKRMHSADLPHFSNDIFFRVYVRYNDESDLDLLRFDEIYERYVSSDTKYVVGRVNLARLHDIREQLAERKIFIAAYPND
ncbi:MAG: homoserine dehydrogenase [Muribaculaceae bacterium]|nr:homoserine dehydrogenase [Muribaculaceae bacterium]